MVLLESLSLPMGTEAEAFFLPGIDGKTYSLDDFKEAKVLAIVFMCNHCPYVRAVWGRLVKLQAKYLDQGVRFVGINSNVDNPDYEEETIDQMAEYYKKYQMNFPYLADTTQETARAYKAQCTPDIFVFDPKRELVYHGRIDDNWQDEAVVTKQELSDALAKLSKGEKPDENQNPSMGCSIKWKN